MKIIFTNHELQYLREKIEVILHLMRKAKEVNLLEVRAAAKMRYKFTPNANNSYLGNKERNLLLDILTYRQNMLVNMADINNEFNIVQSLLEKLQ